MALEDAMAWEGPNCWKTTRRISQEDSELTPLLIRSGEVERIGAHLGLRERRRRKKNRSPCSLLKESPVHSASWSKTETSFATVDAAASTYCAQRHLDSPKDGNDTAAHQRHADVTGWRSAVDVAYVPAAVLIPVVAAAGAIVSASAFGAPAVDAEAARENLPNLENVDRDETQTLSERVPSGVEWTHP